MRGAGASRLRAGSDSVSPRTKSSPKGMSSSRGAAGRYAPAASGTAATPPPAAPPPVPPTTQQLQQAPLALFTQWNETAMQALRGGDGDASRRILAVLLPVVEARLHALECKVPPSRSTGTTAATAVDAWRLMLALTLNNDGCQLRRDGRTADALRQFVRAKDVETAVFGKPSCSTMLNLSAVLLSSGAAEEALVISKECVTAAQDAEPILFITALHNLAVALGQQRAERERKAALPTMLQALREAQSALGEAHPTTVMLKEKCGLSSTWIVPNGSTHATGPVGDLATAKAAGAGGAAAARERSLSPTSRVAQDRARAALHTLNFGDPVPSLPLPRVEVAPTSSEPSSDENERSPAGSSARDGARPGAQASPSVRSDSSRPVHPDAPDTPGRDQAAADEEQLLGLSPLQPSAHRDSSAPASVDFGYADSTNLSGTQFTVGSAVIETVLQEPFQAASLIFNRSVPNHVGPAGTLRSLHQATVTEENAGKAAPSFLRFSVAPPSLISQTVPLPLRKLVPMQGAHGESAVTATVPAGTLTTPSAMPRAAADAGADRRGTRPWRTNVARRASEFDAEEGEGSTTDTIGSSEARFSVGERRAAERARAGHSTAPGTAPATTGAPPSLPTPPQRSLFAKAEPRYVGRATRREVEVEEERAYRAQLDAERQAREAANVFERGLEAVRQRTRNRAALAIQRVWRQWWTSVGHPRRRVQLQRLEELQRRRRERLALGAVAGKRSARSRVVTVPPAPSQQHGTVGGVLVPAVVLRCGRRWLDKTVCLRYLSKSRRSPVDARLREADVRRAICTMQALWRGALVRLRREKQRQREAELLAADPTYEDPVTAAERRRAEAEEREYAVLVLQRAYRCHRARRALRLLFLEHHTGPATTIQRWLRATWGDQRRRGVDAPTVRRLNAAAEAIQRVWRGHVGRVAFRMRELRLRMDRYGASRLAIAEGPALLTVEDRTRIRAAAAAKQAEGAARQKSAASTQALPAQTAQPSAAETAAAEAEQRRVAANEAYAAGCAERNSAVQQLRDAERDKFHIGLYVDVMADKERVAWQETLRLRPSEVVRRRVEMDFRVSEEQRAFTERRAAVVIQRAYRGWRTMQQNQNRDTNLLFYARARYQQRELGNLVAQKQRRRDVAKAVALYGDTAAMVRQEHQRAAEQLALVMGGGQTAASSTGPNSVIALPRPDGRALAPFEERLARNQQRRQQEAAQQRDEALVELAEPHETMHVREGPEECAARIGTTYEHPYYVPYVNDAHLETLGID